MQTVQNIEEVDVSKVTFAGLMKRAAEIQADCHDYNIINVSNKNMYYSAENNRLHFQNESGAHELQLTAHSLRQLCSRLEIPVRYIQKCIDEGDPYLAADNINRWLDDYNRNLFVRCYSDTVRGILTDKYSVMDTPDVISTFAESARKFKVKGYTLNPERFHMRVASEKMLPIKNEDLFIGIELNSSDVGRSTLTCCFMLYKQVCTNGLCITTNIGELFTQRHIGLTSGEFRDALRANINKLPDAEQYIIDVVNEAGIKDYKTLKRVVDYNTWNPDNQKRFIDFAKGLTHMTEDDIIATVGLMYQNYTVTPWGFVNALTDYSKRFTLEKRIEVEKAASSILFGNLLNKR